MLDAAGIQICSCSKGVLPYHVRVQSSSGCFPRKLVSFVQRRDLVGSLRNKDDGSYEKYYFPFSFSVLDHRYIFPFDFAQGSRSSASKANKDCQILLFDVHVVHKTPKVSFPRRISEDDGKQAVNTLHSIMQLLFSLRRHCRPPILISLVSFDP